MVKAIVLKRETSVTGSKLLRGDVVDIPKEVIDKYPEEFRLAETVKKRSDKSDVRRVLKRKKDEKELADELGECLDKKKASYYKKD